MNLVELKELNLSNNRGLNLTSLPDLADKAGLKTPESVKEQSDSLAIIVSIALGILLVFGVVAGVSYVLFFKEIIRKRRQNQRFDESSSINDREAGKNNTFEMKAPTFKQSTALLSRFTNKLLGGDEKLVIIKEISKGGFGYVFKGVCTHDPLISLRYGMAELLRSNS